METKYTLVPLERIKKGDTLSLSIRKRSGSVVFRKCFIVKINHNAKCIHIRYLDEFNHREFCIDMNSVYYIYNFYLEEQFCKKCDEPCKLDFCTQCL